jgi:hypothetical protein
MIIGIETLIYIQYFTILIKSTIIDKNICYI